MKKNGKETGARRRKESPVTMLSKGKDRNTLISVNVCRIIFTVINMKEGKALEAKQMAALFKVLADESRVKIVLELSKAEECCACKLLRIVDCQQPTLSHHMKLLVDSGLVKARKEGKWTYYSLVRERIQELKNILG